MHFTEPEVYCVASSMIDESDLQAYLTAIGAPDWRTGADTNIGELVEVMSRNCYQSFGMELNKNLTRIREDSDEHISHIIEVGHGSVLEHGWVSFFFNNVSRVFTHELVRHRVGVAISQESLRFVRLDDLGCWVPTCFRLPSGAPGAAERIFKGAFEAAEESYNELLDLAARKEGVSFDNLPFEKKKMYTSAARRVAPIGLATRIGWSANIRTIRHVLEMRTHPSAEEEMRLVFGKVGEIVRQKWSVFFADYVVTQVGGYPWYRTANNKV